MSDNKSLWWGLLIAWIAGSAYWHVCQIKNLCEDELFPASTATELVTSPAPPLVILDTPMLRLKSNGNFSFAKSGIIANKSQVYPEIDSLAIYLAANKDKRLTIKGLYSKEESNTTVFPDLGLARATEIKNWLLGKGIPESVFNIQSSVSDHILFENDSIIGGIEFSFSKPLSPIQYFANEQKYESIFKPMELYFESAAESYIKTEQNQKFISEAKRTLSENKERKLIIIGHTDNENSAEWNLALSKARAEILKQQFVTFGIPPTQIVALGKGKFETNVTSDVPIPKRARHRVTIIAN